jgi:hypothetical protein
MKTVPDVIARHPAPTRKLLMELRQLILETARETNGVGPIEEALRWGQHSFQTVDSGSGSTIRIDALRGNSSSCAMYFHCQSGLIASFRERYPKKMKYVGKRSIEFIVGEALPYDELKHCISLALTHHLRKKPTNRRKLQK